MSETRVIVLKNEVRAALKAATGTELVKAAFAGGYVIEGAAKVNVEKTFSGKSTGGAGLGGSIQTVLEKSSETEATVNVGPTVIYGRIHELGGIIKPVFKRFLHFFIEGHEVFAKVVVMPARPYLRPAVDENEEKIGDAVAYQLRDAINRSIS